VLVHEGEGRGGGREGGHVFSLCVRGIKGEHVLEHVLALCVSVRRTVLRSAFCRSYADLLVLTLSPPPPNPPPLMSFPLSSLPPPPPFLICSSSPSLLSASLPLPLFRFLSFTLPLHPGTSMDKCRGQKRRQFARLSTTSTVGVPRPHQSLRNKVFKL
jgi:hypothetical protein